MIYISHTLLTGSLVIKKISLGVHHTLPKLGAYVDLQNHYINMSCIIHLSSLMHMIQHNMKLSNKKEEIPKFSWHIPKPNSVGTFLEPDSVGILKGILTSFGSL